LTRRGGLRREIDGYHCFKLQYEQKSDAAGPGVLLGIPWKALGTLSIKASGDLTKDLGIPQDTSVVVYLLFTIAGKRRETGPTANSFLLCL
jgi:hypothetical protein